MDGSWRRVLIKRGPLEKAMANHFSFLALRIVHEKCVKAAEWAGLILQARILKWPNIPFSSGPRFVRTLHHDPSILGGPTQHGS